MNKILSSIYKQDLQENPSLLKDLQEAVNKYSQQEHVQQIIQNEISPISNTSENSVQNITTQNNITQDTTQNTTQNTTTQTNPPQYKHKYYLSPTQIGELGEQHVIQILEEVFTKDQVKYVAKIAHLGDIIVEYNGRKIMFEVKNKNTITQEDIDKFVKDAQQYPVSVFISLRTKTMQYYQDFFFDNINQNQLLIYLSTDFVKKEVFILLKQFLASNFNPTDLTRQQEKLQRNLNLVLTFKHKLQKIIELIQQIRKKQEELQSLQTQLSIQSESYIMLMEEVSDNQLIKQQITQLQNYCKEINSQAFRKTFVMEQFKELHLEQLTKDQIIKKYQLVFKK